MQQQIQKELLIARLDYLRDIHNRPGTTAVHPSVFTVTKKLILEGRVPNYMAVESLFNYLTEMAVKDEALAEEYADEMVSFIA